MRYANHSAHSNVWWTTIIGLMAFTVTACGQTTSSNDVTSPEGSNKPTWNVDDNGSRASQSGDVDASETSGHAEGQKTADEQAPTTTNASDAFCLPRSTPRTASDVPEIPASIRAIDCPNFEVATSGPSESEKHDRITWKRRGSTLIREVDTRSYSDGGSTTEFQLDDSGRVRTVTHHDRDRRAPKGGTWTTWRFDGEGRLSERSEVTKYWHEDAGWDIDDREEMTQTWRGGRLVERTLDARRDDEDSSREHETDSTRWTWSYDEQGRLRQGRIETDRYTYSVQWSYDENRPARAEHRLDGRIVFERTWSYRDDGELERRRVQFRSGEIEMAKLQRLIHRHDLDQYGLDMRHDYYRRDPERLDERNSKASDRDCDRLPASVSFGYPTDRPEYRLVWKHAGALEQVPELPFIAAFGYYYGTLPSQPGMWFGHRGAMGERPAQQALLATGRGTVEVRYDESGRMTSQIVQRDDTLVQKRERSFEGGELATDRVVWNGELEVIRGDSRNQSVLRFERDDRGRMTKRTLINRGSALGQQRFEHADAGYVDTIHIAVPPRGRLASGNEEDIAIEDLERVATYRRTLDDEGRPLRFTEEQLKAIRGSEKRERITTYTYGPHGLVDRTTSPVDEENVLEGIRREYNDEGRLRREFTVRDDVVQKVEKRRYDEAGRPLERRTTRPDGGIEHLETYHYQCLGGKKK